MDFTFVIGAMDTVYTSQNIRDLQYTSVYDAPEEKNDKNCQKKYSGVKIEFRMYDLMRINCDSFIRLSRPLIEVFKISMYKQFKIYTL